MGFRRFDSHIASYTQIDMWETYQHVTNLISHPNITKIPEMMTIKWYTHTKHCNDVPWHDKRKTRNSIHKTWILCHGQQHLNSKCNTLSCLKKKSHQYTCTVGEQKTWTQLATSGNNPRSKLEDGSEKSRIEGEHLCHSVWLVNVS